MIKLHHNLEASKLPCVRPPSAGCCDDFQRHEHQHLQLRHLASAISMSSAVVLNVRFLPTCPQLLLRNTNSGSSFRRFGSTNERTNAIRIVCNISAEFYLSPEQPCEFDTFLVAPSPRLSSHLLGERADFFLLLRGMN